MVTLRNCSGTRVAGESRRAGTGPALQAAPVLGIGVLFPPAGVPGAEVTLNGEGFGSVAAQNIVRFNGTLAAVVSASTRSLVVRVPALVGTETFSISLKR